MLRSTMLDKWRTRGTTPAPNRAARRALQRARRRRGGALLSVAMVVSTLLAPAVVQAQVAPPAAEHEVDFTVTRHDLEFILRQIRISENHAAGGQLLCADPNDASGTCVPDPRLPWGLRTVDGSYNNLMPGQSNFGAGSQVFPRLLNPDLRVAQPLPFDPDGPGPGQPGDQTSYTQTRGMVVDAEPRIISNLIVDQTAANPAALTAAQEVPGSYRYDHDADATTPDRVFIPNEAPDEGLSAPFTSWFTLFGQFFDHGLDLVSKGGSGVVMVPLQPDDPLYVPGSHTNFIMLTRATNQPGLDGVLGTADDVHEHQNRTTPFVDQNQTYTSHPSHQFFLREYEMVGGLPVPTGRLLDAPGGGLATWADIKAQARTMLGIELDDLDVLNVPLVATDPYGHFIPGPNGLPQLVELVDGANTLVEASLTAPVDATRALRAGHAFLDDIAHAAAPVGRTGPLAADEDTVIGAHDAVLNGVYDNELLERHYITGDGRGNENIGLTAVHHVFHSEHNRLVAHIDEVLQGQDAEFQAAWRDESGPWNYGERLFQAARFVTEMQYQHMVFEEFGRTIQPTIDNQPTNETAYHADINPAIAAEFAHVVYRFGHSMLTDTVDRRGFEAQSLSLFDAFLNPEEFTDNGRLTADQGAAAVIQGMARQTGNGIDEFVDDTLRNELLGLPLDLAAINIARGRDTGVPRLQAARAELYAASLDPALKPYDNWEDFRLALKHRASIVNFVAAYAQDPRMEAAVADAQANGTSELEARRTTAAVLVADAAFMNGDPALTGLNDVDFWVGGLAESAMVFGGMLGTTFNAVFEGQLEDLQNGDRFYYLNRNQGLNLLHQLEANSFAELIMRNTDASLLPADVFANPEFVFDLANLPTPLEDGLTRQADGTYRFDGEAHVTIHGTGGDDRMRGGLGDDSLWGHAGSDRIEGDVGNDIHHGGAGDDILTDLFGDDTIHAGRGDDVVNGGPGLDLLFGGSGTDFLLHGNEITESFGGADDDLIRGGSANDILTGNEGDDWLEGARGHDLVQGDNRFTFQNDPFGGHDVLIGGSGNDDHDAEGGDDVLSNNGVDRHEGMLGFDWVTHQHDPFAATADMDRRVFQPAPVETLQPRYDSVEALSGAGLNDVLRGTSNQDDITLADGTGNELTQAGIDRVVGLRDLLGGGETPRYAAPHMTPNPAGDIILGGRGSDIIEGRAGDDFIDGDAQLEVFLVRYDAGGVEVERQTSMQAYQARMFSGELKPGDLHIVREIGTVVDAGVVNTAVYSDVIANYEITNNGDGTVTVAHVDGPASDGIDTLRNIQRLTFADGTVNVVDVANTPATGTVAFSTTSPIQGQEVTATPTIVDPDGIGALSFTWQQQLTTGEWVAVSGEGDDSTFTPTQAEVGSLLRVVVTFTDGKGVLESVTSEAIGPVADVNDPATAPTLSSTTPEVGVAITASTPTDPDGTTTSTFSFQWEAGDGTTFSAIAGATDASFTPTEAQVGQQLRVVVSFVDDAGNSEAATSAASSPVAAPVVAPAAPTLLSASVGDGTATLTWSPPATDGGSAITSFQVVVRAGATVQQTVTGIEPTATSTVISGLTNGTAYTFTVQAVNAKGVGAESAPSAAVSPVAPAPAARSGYWMVGSDGLVHSFGEAQHLGNAPVGAATAEDVEPTPSGNGYWVVSSTGSVYAFGDAQHLGGAGQLRAGEIVTGISATPTGDGYWLFTSLGRVIAKGGAAHVGDMDGVRLNGPVLDAVATPSGKGYYMVASDGGVFAFGDARFAGSMGGQRLNGPVQSLVPDGDGQGYWLVATDGGIFAFDAPFHGSMGGTRLNKPVTGMVAFGSAGYLMVAEDGGTFAFGTARFHGSLGDRPPAKPITAIAVLKG